MAFNGMLFISDLKTVINNNNVHSESGNMWKGTYKNSLLMELCKGMSSFRKLKWTK